MRELTPERSKIAECMVWCVDHADAADEVGLTLFDIFVFSNTIINGRSVYDKDHMSELWIKNRSESERIFSGLYM